MMWLIFILLPASVCSFAAGVFMIIGSRKMMRLESYRWSMAASVAALLPCSPVSLLGMVMGIWSLAVLNRRNVIAAYDAQAGSGAASPATGADPRSTASRHEAFGHSSGGATAASAHQGSDGLARISLWSAILGVFLPVLMLLGGILLSSRVSNSDGFVAACFLLGVGLELVAVVCGIIARATKSGKAGLIIGSVALVLWLWLATLPTIPTQIQSAAGPTRINLFVAWCYY